MVPLEIVFNVWNRFLAVQRPGYNYLNSASVKDVLKKCCLPGSVLDDWYRCVETKDINDTFTQVNNYKGGGTRLPTIS